jgi:hypothetical protein
MIDPAQLLDVAVELSAQPGRGAPRQAKLRRAISSAYYALFHHFLTEASDLLVGQVERSTERYTLVYRSFEHRRMADSCKKISSEVSRSAWIRNCASLFVQLQNSRHEADYDPNKRVALSEVKTAITKARTAINLLSLVADSERRFFLTALLLKSRS